MFAHNGDNLIPTWVTRSSRSVPPVYISSSCHLLYSTGIPKPKDTRRVCVQATLHSPHTTFDNIRPAFSCVPPVRRRRWRSPHWRRLPGLESKLLSQRRCKTVLKGRCKVAEGPLIDSAVLNHSRQRQRAQPDAVVNQPDSCSSCRRLAEDGC